MEVPYSSPVALSMYPTLGGMFILAGFISTAMFFVYQLSSSKRSLAIELSLGGVSSVALGFGTLFVLLSFGLYV
jgi:UDP-N-acetylmuramyl pentapeptide phosphotransferase/UDP-N-acetylglucosamine-1-phosphate transferase